MDSQNELEKFFKMISPSLKVEVIKHIFSKVLAKSDIFSEDKDLIKYTTDRLETEIHLPDKYVVVQGQVSNGLYFISNGILEIRVKNENGKERVCN